MKHRQFINSALLDNNVGKIELWGDVYETQPCDLWTGEPLDTQCITIKDFKEALSRVQNCSSIELHLNSYGGDATVGIAIHNLLKASGKKITCVIDAVAASAAFTIAMAADEVKVYPGSILMCHEVKSFMFGYYGNEDLKKIENGNTAYNNSAAAMYSQKSGMSKSQCLNLMKKETWMTGAEAVDYGFADSLIETGEDNAPVELVNKTTMKINGVEHDISGLKIPDEFLQHTKGINITNSGGDGMSKTNLKDQIINAISSIFKNDAEVEEEDKKDAVIEEEEKQNAEGEEEAPEEEKEQEEEKANVSEVEIANSAIEAERKRIQEIEAIAGSIDADLVQEAKFGNSACDAKELALRAMQRENEKANQALDKLQSDNEDSKVNEVGSEAAKADDPSELQTKTDIENSVKALFEKINKAKEGK